MSKKITYSILVLVVIVFAGVVFAMKYFSVDERRCLGDNEEAGFYDKIGKFEKEGIPEKYPLEVILRNIDAKVEIDSFQIEDIRENYHPAEIHKCGVYVLRQFNYDYEKSKKVVGYRNEFWRYNYSGKGEKALLLAEKPDEYISYYNSDFRVDPLERYVALSRGYLGKENHALVIKDLKSKEDVFILSHDEISEKTSKRLGDFNMKEWAQDGRYFWGNIANAASVPVYFRIDSETWNYEVFDALEGQMGGEKLNMENGWVTHHTDLVWTGFVDMQEEIKLERREQGIGTKFYLHNLITGEKILIYETDEPMWFTKPKWLSATELEYELPDGEKMIYELSLD